MKRDLFIGLLSGTSMDGIDAGLVDFDTSSHPKLIASRMHPMPMELRERLMLICADNGKDYVDELAKLDALLGHAFAEAAIALIKQTDFQFTDIRAIGTHGQTIRHRPTNHTPFTLQIADPNIIAERTGITTIADFRRRDMAAGGQAAPLVPAFHQAVFQNTTITRVVINIGGISNITILPAKSESQSNNRIIGFDTGPGNVLLDTWAKIHLGAPMDEHGRWAKQGKSDPRLLERLCSDRYFSMPPPKTTGREWFNLDWLEKCIADVTPLPPPVDVQRTLCDLTVTTLRDAILNHAPTCQEVLICGGGSRNPMLTYGLKTHLPDCLVDTTTYYSIDPDWVEAMAFAWLARQRLYGLPGNIPSVTGARHSVVLGAIYPGR